MTPEQRAIVKSTVPLLETGGEALSIVDHIGPKLLVAVARQIAIVVLRGRAGSRDRDASSACGEGRRDTPANARGPTGHEHVKSRKIEGDTVPC